MLRVRGRADGWWRRREGRWISRRRLGHSGWRGGLASIDPAGAGRRVLRARHREEARTLGSIRCRGATDDLGRALEGLSRERREADVSVLGAAARRLFARGTAGHGGYRQFLARKSSSSSRTESSTFRSSRAERAHPRDRDPPGVAVHRAGSAARRYTCPDAEVLPVLIRSRRASGLRPLGRIARAQRFADAVRA